MAAIGIIGIVASIALSCGIMALVVAGFWAKEWHKLERFDELEERIKKLEEKK